MKSQQLLQWPRRGEVLLGLSNKFFQHGSIGRRKIMMSSESTIIPPNDPLKKYPTLCLSASQIDCISNGLAKDLKTQSMA